MSVEGPADSAHVEEYQRRLQDEIDFHKDYVDIHALPSIFSYWSNTYVRPMLQAVGSDSPNEFAANGLLESAKRCRADEPIFVSIGAGNCDTEIALASMLIDAGLTRFRIECVDINPYMLERGRAQAAEEGLSEFVVPIVGDFNDWRPERVYECVIANQSLHHVMNLEGLFAGIDRSLHPDGLLVINDMIGRNGHQRWPEALAHVRRFWDELPMSYRYNHLLRRQEVEYENWDCSQQGFEGVRSQDILPLLIERFEFEVFVGFGNVIDVFVDRPFGHNFDGEGAWDRRFVDRVHAVDEAGFASGELTPTHAFAVVGKRAVERPQYARGLTPRAAVRLPTD